MIHVRSVLQQFIIRSYMGKITGPSIAIAKGLPKNNFYQSFLAVLLKLHPVAYIIKNIKDLIVVLNLVSSHCISYIITV